MFGTPKRITRQRGRHAVVDGIPFTLPVETRGSRAVLAAFAIDADRAAELLPGDQVHPFRVWGRGLLFVTVIDYRETTIGQYIEYSVAIACTHGSNPAPRLLPALLQGPYGFGQYVIELPVSTEVSVKGGKGIWGMPKHQAPLDFVEDGRTVSSQYDLDGTMVMRLDMRRPRLRMPKVPAMQAVNYGAFRGMLVRSVIRFGGTSYLSMRPLARARLTLGDHPRTEPLRRLNIAPNPLFTVYQDNLTGYLDDHVESWFLTAEGTPTISGEGLNSVVSLGLSREWPPPPDRAGWSAPW